MLSQLPINMRETWLGNGKPSNPWGTQRLFQQPLSQYRPALKQNTQKFQNQIKGMVGLEQRPQQQTARWFSSRKAAQNMNTWRTLHPNASQTTRISSIKKIQPRKTTPKPQRNLQELIQHSQSANFSFTSFKPVRNKGKIVNQMATSRENPLVTGAINSQYQKKGFLDRNSKIGIKTKKGKKITKQYSQSQIFNLSESFQGSITPQRGVKVQPHFVSQIGGLPGVLVTPEPKLPNPNERRYLCRQTLTSEEASFYETGNGAGRGHMNFHERARSSIDIINSVMNNLPYAPK